jgi:hypothetical protein
MTKTFFRTLLLFLLIVLISAGIGAAHYFLRGGTIAGLGGSGAAVVQAAQRRLAEVTWSRGSATPPQAAPQDPPQDAPQAPQQAGPQIPQRQNDNAIRLYFTLSDGADGEKIDEAFLEFLRSAKKSIYGAFYDFQWMDAARVLVEKRGEGVDVALVSKVTMSAEKRRLIANRIEAISPATAEAVINYEHVRDLF